MNFTKKHFSACQFNPLEDNLLNAYPALAEFAEGFEGEAAVRPLRYLIAMYDPASPLRQLTSLPARKMQAAQLSGFDLIAEEMVLESMYSFDATENKKFLLMANAYFARFIRHRTWVSICTFEQVWWEYNQKMLDRVRGDNSKQELEALEKKSKIRVEMSALHQELTRLWDDFYGKGNEDLKLSSEKSNYINPETIQSVLG
jgi:hypothetical protein